MYIICAILIINAFAVLNDLLPAEHRQSQVSHLIIQIFKGKYGRV